LEERRSFSRIPIAAKVDFVENGKADTKDISIGGICFVTSEVLNKELLTILYIQIPMKGSILASGFIIRKKSITPELYEYGLIFNSLDDDGSYHLRSYIEENFRYDWKIKKYPRLPMEISVNCAHTGILKASCIDIHGLTISIVEEIPIDTRILLTLYFPKNEMTSAEGKVVSCIKLDEVKYEVRIEFLNMDESTKMILLKLNNDIDRE